MVSMTVGFKVQFREQIRKFCFDNDIQISYRNCLGNFDTYIIDIETYNINKLMMYVEQLERERKKKSFWWRLWN